MDGKRACGLCSKIVFKDLTTHLRDSELDLLSVLEGTTYAVFRNVY
jgi:hypothetical protein